MFCSLPTEIHDFLIGSHRHLVILPSWPIQISVPCILFTQKATYLTPPTNITVLVRTPWTSIQMHTGVHIHTFPITASLCIPPNKDLTTINTTIYAFFLFFLSPWLRFIKSNLFISILNSQVYNTFLIIIVIDSLIISYHSPNPLISQLLHICHSPL